MDGEGFYQKQIPHLPSWVPTVDVSTDGQEARYIMCGDRDTLLYVVNLGSIDFHPWLSRIDDLDAPDWAVIDLDAKGSSFAKVVRVAEPSPGPARNRDLPLSEDPPASRACTSNIPAAGG